MATIHDEAEVIHSKTTDNTDIFTVKFSDAIMFVEDVKPSKELIEAFKKGVLAERERLWDQAAEIDIDEEILAKLLQHNTETI